MYKSFFLGILMKTSDLIYSNYHHKCSRRIQRVISPNFLHSFSLWSKYKREFRLEKKELSSSEAL